MHFSIHYCAGIGIKSNDYRQTGNGSYYNFSCKNKGGSILVRASGSQDGPKNPLKGISMKSLVPASLAQIGVGAGG